jgi:outer membrane receptor protein involved in Fe transport
MLFLEGRYIGPASTDVLLARSAQEYESTGAYWEWNAAVGYDLTKNVTATVSVADLFNQNPPPNSYVEGGQAALSTYDYLGQRFVLTLRAKF